METSATVKLLAWISRLVLVLLLSAVGWITWVALQNWHGISV